MNMTMHEAHQRMNVNRASMRNDGRGNYTVMLNESRDVSTAYTTDDLEDAVLMAGTMRRRSDNNNARKFIGLMSA